MFKILGRAGTPVHGASMAHRLKYRMDQSGRDGVTFDEDTPLLFRGSMDGLHRNLNGTLIFGGVDMNRETVTGVVSVIGKTTEYGTKGFQKREVVLEQQQGEWVNYIPVEFTYEDCDLVDRLQQGDEITVEYELKGRKYQPKDASGAPDPSKDPKYFVNIHALSFEGGSDPVHEEQQESEKVIDVNQDRDGADIPF